MKAEEKELLIANIAASVSRVSRDAIINCEIGHFARPTWSMASASLVRHLSKNTAAPSVVRMYAQEVCCLAR